MAAVLMPALMRSARNLTSAGFDAVIDRIKVAIAYFIAQLDCSSARGWSAAFLAFKSAINSLIRSTVTWSSIESNTR